MTSSTSFAANAPLSRRSLVAAGGTAAVAAMAGLGTARMLDSRSAAGPPADGTGGATPAPRVAPATPTAEPTARTIGFAQPTETPAATPGVASVQAVDPAGILEEVTIRQLREYLDSGAFSVVELLEATLARIEEYDSPDGEIAVNAVISLNPDALDIAAGLDAELQAGQSRGPMHGIPVLLKDIFATGDRMANTAGSLAMQENIPVRDSFLVARLREAGAVILGKTNLTEWSNFMGSTGLSGWSSLGGLTVNPYNLNMSTSGSSSGSAAAVAASYVPVALGAEFDGSIIAPSSQCGVVGVKPTVGLTSRAGVIPIGFSRDSTGPIARTVEDAAIALSVLAGLDPEDPSRTVGLETSPHARFETEMVPEPGTADYVSALDPDALRGARIGICTNYGGFDEGSQALFDAVLPILAEAGAEVIDNAPVRGLDGLSSTYVNSLTEFAWGLQRYLTEYTPDGPMRTIQDIVDYNFAHEEETLVMTDQSGLTDALDALPIDSQTYLDVTINNQRAIRDNGIDATMDDLELDALIAPTATIATGRWERAGFNSSSYLSSIAGYPSVTLPIGVWNGLPAGIHFFGRAFSEATLLGLAYALEQRLPPRAIPGYIPREG